MIEFTPFPKIARLNREVVVTEKIDGTNASVTIVTGQPEAPSAHLRTAMVEHEGRLYDIFAGSRTRFITPGADNFGFARWVFEHAQELVTLGEGTHFGEWWGKGIQRGYGLTEKRFSLFNTYRWGIERPACCHVVPVLRTGLGMDMQVEMALADLRYDGSVASPGFGKPEGVVAFHTHANSLFKVTLEKDEEHKFERRVA